MNEIWKTFEQFETLMNSEHGLRDLQEITELSRRLLMSAEVCFERKLRDDVCDSIPFLSDADCRFGKCGQCGDDVYWKIVGNTLYIGGNGSMWSFDTSASDLSSKTGLYPLWCGSSFDLIVICPGVTAIGGWAFEGVHASNVIIPESVKVIGEGAFFDAKIETLSLPETLDTIDEMILCSMGSREVGTLFVSANIPHIKPLSLYNRNGIVANRVVLTGNKPSDPTDILESGIFDHVNERLIYWPEVHYPQGWDECSEPFAEAVATWVFGRLSSWSEDDVRRKIKEKLITYNCSDMPMTVTDE